MNKSPELEAAGKREASGKRERALSGFFLRELREEAHALG